MPSQPIYLRSSLLLSSHLCLGLLSSLFLSDFPTESLYTLLIPTMHAAWPGYSILLHLITLITFSEHTSYDAPHYEAFSSLPSLPP